MALLLHLVEVGLFLLLGRLASLLVARQALPRELAIADRAELRLVADGFMEEDVQRIELIRAELARCRSSTDSYMFGVVVAREVHLAARTLGWLVTVCFVLVKLVQRLDNLAEFAVGGCWTLGFVPVNHRLRELNQATAALSRAFALDLMGVQIAHWVLIPADAAPHWLVTGHLVPLNIGPGKLQVAKAAPHRLIAVLLVVLQLCQRFLFLAETTAGRATQPTMGRRIPPSHPLKANRTLIVWQLVTVSVAICVVRG